MVSLSKQYIIEVEKIDNAICKRLKEALPDGISKEDQRLYSAVLSRREEILSLFNGSFSENENKLREAIENGRLLKSKPKVSRSSKFVNRVLKEKVDEVIDKLIGEDSRSAITASVGIDRKTFIGAILDGNVEIGLKKDVLQHEDKERE